MPKIKILIVEDDSNLAYLLQHNLEKSGFDVVCSDDGKKGWNAYLEHHFDLCILDIMMPYQDGYSLAKMIRNYNETIPILFLTARDLEEDVYKGFEIGADDYVIKPVSVRELLFRVNAILKRTNISTRQFYRNEKYHLSSYEFDPHSQELLHEEGESYRLSPKETEVLRVLCQGINTVVKRKSMLLEIWGDDDYFSSKSLDVYISKIRKKLNLDPNIILKNYHGLGYKLVVKNRD